MGNLGAIVAIFGHKRSSWISISLEIPPLISPAVKYEPASRKENSIYLLGDSRVKVWVLEVPKERNGRTRVTLMIYNCLKAAFASENG